MLPLSFSYHRSLAPMLWMLVGLAGLELLLGHFLIALWNITAAIILSVLTAASIAWLVAQIRSFNRLPVIVDCDEVLFRTGTLHVVPVAVPNIADVRQNFPSEALKAKTVLNLAMMSYPNILVNLHEPIPRGRRSTINAIAHRLDDPAGFAAAIAAARSTCSEV